MHDAVGRDRLDPGQAAHHAWVRVAGPSVGSDALAAEAFERVGYCGRVFEGDKQPLGHIGVGFRRQGGRDQERESQRNAGPHGFSAHQSPGVPTKNGPVTAPAATRQPGSSEANGPTLA